MSDSSGEESVVSSSSSMVKDVVGSSRYYSVEYKRTVSKYFPSILKRAVGTPVPGLDHTSFLSNIKLLNKDGTWSGDDLNVLYEHVMCNQYVRAAKISTAPWESDSVMAPFYDNGKLKRYTGKALKASSSDESLEDQMDNMSDDESDHEEKIKDVDGVTVQEILKNMELDKLTDVAKKAEAFTHRTWMNLKQTEVPEASSNIKEYKTYIYPDDPESRKFITSAIKSSVLKVAQGAQKRGRTSLMQNEFGDRPVKQVKVEPASSYTSSSSYGNYGGNEGTSSSSTSMRDMMSRLGGRGASSGSDGQIYWGNVLSDINMSEAYAPGDNPDQMEKDIGMLCGLRYCESHADAPQKNPITKRRKYTQEHYAGMKSVAEAVKAELMKLNHGK